MSYRTKMPRPAAFCLLAISFLAVGPVRAANPWDAYNLAPASRTLSPVAIYKTNGTVQNPNNMLTGGSALIQGAGSYITVDFGKEVGGIATVIFTAASDTTQSVGFAFSEAPNYVGTASDASNGSPNPDGALTTTVTSTGNYTYTMPTNKVRGGFRYMTIFMNTPGWVHVSTVSLNFTAVPAMATPNAYPNYFYCNDALLNKLWYAGAYTTQMDIISPIQGRVWGPPASGWDNSATIASGISVLSDGAKRDRTVWPGDVGVSGGTAYVSIDDTASLRNALQRMYDSQQVSGELPFAGPALNVYGSDTYHMWTLVGTHSYYLYSGDITWLNSIWAKYQAGVTFMRNKVNGAHGLLNVTGGNDWARNGQGGENIEANALLYRVLVTGAALATAEGNASLSTTYANAAATLKANINSALWVAGQGAYRDNPTSITYPQDGNALAVWFDVTDSPAKAARVAGYLRSNWSTFGSRTPEWNNNISPFPGSFELQALEKAGSDVDALSLMRREWGYMTNAPGMPQTFWEGMNNDGSFAYGGSYMSCAHGWSTGPTLALTSFTLGIQPTTAKGVQFSVIPHPGDLTHVEGQLTVAAGKVVKVSYDRANNSSFNIAVDSSTNSGSSGVVAVPKFGTNRTILVNGVTAWSGTAFTGATGIASADQDSSYVYFRGVQPAARTFSYTGSQLTWQTCANENASCAFSGTKGVRYGSGTTFVYAAFTSGAACTNASFGDPTPNVAKHCEVSDTEIPPMLGVWTACAAENATCSFPNTKMVAFGAQGKYNFGSNTTSVACTTAVFADPIFGVAKSCYQSTTPTNPGFESPTTADYAYNPGSASWTFSAQNGNAGSGVQKPGNNGSWGAAFVPEGAQSGFVQDGGSISQTISNMTAGTYAVTLKAARRAAFAGQQSFTVTIDSTQIGSFSPTSTIFTSFTTSSIALATGNHTLTIKGTNTTGDNTDFIDGVGLLRF